MSIDPVKHRRQLSLIHRGEYKCPGCGRRTRDTQGRCRTCRRTAPPYVGRLNDDQLVALVQACKEEMQRRRNQLLSEQERRIKALTHGIEMAG